jgi:hypothetical protein
MIYDRIWPFLVAEGVHEIGLESKWLEVTGRSNQKWSTARGETGYWRIVKCIPSPAPRPRPPRLVGCLWILMKQGLWSLACGAYGGEGIR